MMHLDLTAAIFRNDLFSCFLGAFLASFRVPIVICIAGGDCLQKR